MLLDQLERESRDAKRRQLLFAAVLAGGAILVGAFFFGLVAIEFEPAGQPASAERPQAETPATSPADRREEKAADSAAAPAGATVPDAASEAAREDFKAGLAAFQADVEPVITHEDFARWNPRAQREILDLKDEAVRQFGSGNYGEAVETLAAAGALSEREVAAADTAFEQALAKAGAAANADDHDEAALQIARALEIRPGSEVARDLKARIDELPELLAQIENAAIARVGNNLRAEAKHLQAALDIDPGRTELAARLESVRTELRERDFAARITDGFAGVEARDPVAARRGLQAAEKIFPDRGEADVLAEKIATLELDLMIERLVTTARAAAAADDWGVAERNLVEANRLFPDDREIMGNLELARAINAIDRRLDQYLAAPQRFASEDVAAGARTVMSEADGFAAQSPTLAAKAGRVGEVVAAYATKVPVRLLSDGETNISVRGVGVVGTTTDRTIELRPGTYTIEGIRAGFRAKLLRVDIPPGTENLVLEIFPNERI